MGTGHIRAGLVLVFSAIVAAAGIVIVRQSARLNAFQQQHTRDLRAIEQLRASLRQQPTQNPASPAIPEGAPGAVRACPGTPEKTDGSGSDAAAGSLQSELDGARSSIERLQGQIDGFEREKQAAVAAATGTFQQHEQDLRSRLEALRGQLDTARAEAEGAKASRERAASLEAENAKIKNEDGVLSARIAEVRKSMGTLQDLDRRRDGYLNSIIRHSRDIVEQFRAMTGVIDSSRASGSSSFSDVALSRIQNATSQAEEDLRRLNELNAQAHQIESRLAKN
jgi:DNA repair exonuclease SbcCD ATPase subunit